MNDDPTRRIEFGDFQTPQGLALASCQKLITLGISPDVIVEPTCGVGAFVMAAATVFPNVKGIYGFELNRGYLSTLEKKLLTRPKATNVMLLEADFFDTDWGKNLSEAKGNLLVLGNFPWVTNSALGVFGGTNMPSKSNFQGHVGFDAMTGKANFDISEWMLLEVFSWFRGRSGAIAMLVKTAVARKVLAQAQQQQATVKNAFIYNIDAKKHFGAAVDACLLVVILNAEAQKPSHEYTVFKDLDALVGTRVGHRDGRSIRDLDNFDATQHLLGKSPQKWRSGVKHDAAAIMELTRTTAGLMNGLDELVEIEETYLFPLMKGSDVASSKKWRQKFSLVPQRAVGQATTTIEDIAPRTWQYLQSHSLQLDSRGSSIYAKNPRFSVFGVGDYAFKKWKIAICALYKKLEFQLVGPIEGKPVVFDDTVYYISFDTQSEAQDALEKINNQDTRRLMTSMIFWDEKRPIKTTILNSVDFEKVTGHQRQASLI